jgi:sulfur carrier protein ThiS
MRIRLLTLGKSADTLEMDPDASVHDVLDQSNVELQGRSVTVNGVGCDLAAQLRDGDIITITPKVQGG